MPKNSDEFSAQDIAALSGDWLRDDDTSESGYEDGYYCPIYIEPMVGSGERLCIAVVAATPGDLLVVRTPGLERLKCFYDDSAALLLRMSEEICLDLENRLSISHRHGVGVGQPLSEFWKSPFEGFFTGTPQWANGKGVEEIAEIGLQMCSSLVGARPTQENRKTDNLTRPRLVERVKSQVLGQRDWGIWFDASIPAFPSLRFDFLGQRLAAHIGLLPSSDLTQNVNDAKSGVLDLRLLKVQDQKQLWQPLDERRIEHYCVLLHIDPAQIAKNGRQTNVQKNRDQLLFASQELGVEVRPCYSTEEIAEELIKLEAA